MRIFATSRLTPWVTPDNATEVVAAGRPTPDCLQEEA